MKITILSACIFLAIRSTTTFAGNPINIPVKISELFHHSFPEVKNETWYKIQDSYEAYFKSQDGSSCKIYYSRTGKLLYTFKYYQGKDLPLFISTRLAEKYNGANIFNVTEVYANDKTVYYILLDDQQKWYKVEADANGEITLDETLLKEK